MDNTIKDRLVEMLENRVDQLDDEVEWKNTQLYELHREREDVKNSLEMLKSKIEDESKDLTIESLAGHILKILDLFKEYDNPIEVNNQTGAGNALTVPGIIRMNARSGASEGPDPSFKVSLVRSISSSGTSTTYNLSNELYEELNTKD